jgi:hypothetical protein
MSLSYSVWQSDSETTGGTAAPSRKRVPSIGIRKTIKARPQFEDTIAHSSYDSSDVSSSSTAEPAETFEVAQQKQADMSERVHHLLDGITGFSDGGDLGDFNPMPYPTQLIHKTSPSQPVQNKISPDEPVHVPGNPLMPKTRAVLSKSGKPENDLYFRPSSSDMPYANYRDAYSKEGMVSGILGDTTAKKTGPSYGTLGGDKMTEKLNYLIQMVEGMQMEKTSHITEEFILYCLLGTFMIYIVDGFSRGGKYIR